ncbi:MAG: PQQ-binding-like beta-propeller repeat protein [Alphaproteobacteria bacterium]
MSGHRSLRPFAVLLLLLLLLAGCDWVESMLPSRKPPPLPGERIAVMVNEGELEADPRVADLRVMLPKPYANAAWPESGGVPTHAMYHLGLAAAPSKAWQVDIGDGSQKGRKLLSRPVVADDRVFVMDIDFEISAYGAATGERLWHHESKVPKEDREAFGGGLAYSMGRLYVTTGFGDVIALDAQTGGQVWKQTLPGPMRAAPTVAGGRLYVVTIDNQLNVLDADTGEKKWTHTAISESAGLLGGGSVAVDGSTVVVPYSSGEIFAMRAENGRVVWSDNLTAIRRIDAMASLAHIRGSPVIDRGIVYAVSHSGRLVAIDQRSGARAWERSIGGVDMPWVAGEFIFVLSNDNELYCLTREGGRIRWVQPLPRYENPDKKKDPIRWAGPVLAGDRLIVTGSHGEVMTVSPYTGEPLGRMSVPDGILMPPVVAKETIYFLTDDADLIAYR